MPGGNPNHDPKNGKFTTGSGSSTHGKIGTRSVLSSALHTGSQSYRSESEARSVANSLTGRGFQAQVREGGAHGYQVAHNAPEPGASHVHDYIMAKGGASPNVGGHNVIGSHHVGGKRSR